MSGRTTTANSATAPSGSVTVRTTPSVVSGAGTVPGRLGDERHLTVVVDLRVAGELAVGHPPQRMEEPKRDVAWP